MRVQDFTDMNQFESIMKDWAMATGLATVAVGADGKYISDCYNFTDFCINLTRGSAEGKRRCEKCDRECSGIYRCHAGLIDFSLDLVVNGEKLGAVIGGQVLPQHPNEEEFRKVASEIGVDPDTYIEALKKVNVKTEESITASANLLGATLNSIINISYANYMNEKITEKFKDGVVKCEEEVKSIKNMTSQLDSIQRKQNILSINASIEAANAGEAGRGFNVVAKEVGNLSRVSENLNKQIFKCVQNISDAVHDMTILHK